MTRASDLLDIDAYVPFFVRSIANRLAQAASREYKQEFGIGLSEWSCLAALTREPDISAARICAISGFDKALISRALGSLESKGLITGRSATDRYQKKLIRLTAEGHSTYRQILVRALRREQRLLKGIPSPERAHLLELLRAMHANALSLADGPSDEEADGAPARRQTVSVDLEE